MRDDATRILHDTAVDLYVHEDRLNWVKLNNLFYVNGGLLVILGLGVNLSDGLIPLSRDDALVIQVVSSLGLLASGVFAAALHFGVKYLLARKAAVIRLENRLTEDSDCRVVSPAGENAVGLGASPTAWLLRITPYLIAAAWAGLLIASVVG